MKTCARCHQEKEISSYQKDKHTKDGYNPSCRECRKAAKRISYLKHKTEILNKQCQKRQVIQDWINQYKTKCSECPETHPACMDFHHIADKEKGIANLVNRGTLSARQKERILFEIRKCIVLCSNCHRKLHWNERRKNRSVS